LRRFCAGLRPLHLASWSLVQAQGHLIIAITKLLLFSSALFFSIPVMDVGWLRAVRGLCTKMLASVSTKGTKGDDKVARNLKKVWSPRSKLLMSVRCIFARPPSMIKLPGTFCCWDHACMRRPAGRPGILISVCRAIRRIGPRRQVFREEDSFVDVHLVRIPRKGRQAGLAWAKHTVRIGSCRQSR
jgi:hypothetical protein